MSGLAWFLLGVADAALLLGALTLLIVPTWRLALVAAFVAAGVAFLPGNGWLWLLGIGHALVLLAVLDAFGAPHPRLVAVERTLPSGVTLGGEGTISWTVTNTSKRGTRVSLSDELAPSLRASSREAGGKLPGRGTLRASVQIRPARRGRFRPRRMVVRVEGPFGLGARQAARSMPGELRVFPSFRSKDDAELRIRKARLLEVGLRSARGRGGGTEFEQLREYGIDDEFRRIDWAASARSGKTIVRTYRSERNQTVLVLLDNGRVMAGRVDGVPRVEHAMDAVMALTTVATGLGDRCGLVAFDREVRAVVPPRHGRGQLARVVEALYDLEPALVESDYAGAFTETLARFRRRTMLVVLTDLAEVSVNEWLVPALPLIVRDHLVVVAGVLDPDVARWATSESPDSSTAYRRAAAVASVGDRQKVVARLRGLGATVVDARPGQLATLLADTYLDIKATGRL